MQSAIDLYRGVREKFPVTAERVDQIHILHWDEVSEDMAYVWFESLAELVNQDMSDNVPYDNHRELIQFLSDAALTGKAAVTDCVDACFVENLFWRVPKDQQKKYWSPLPSPLKELYVRFHKHAPL